MLPARPLLEMGRLLDTASAPAEPEAVGETSNDRVTALVHRYFDGVWKFLRRLGVPADAVDDAAQQTFVVAARKVDQIEPAGERQYLFAIAVRIAADARRARSRRRELADDDSPRHADPLPGPDELLDRKRARELLDDVLASMPLDLRAAFTMFELEGMTLPEVAAVLGVPLGTATSRLRRARELFQGRVQRLTRSHTCNQTGSHE